MAEFDLLYIAGRSGNLLTRAQSVTPNDADSLFPIERLYNGEQDEIFRWGSNGADRLWTADLAGVQDPGFEDAALTPWEDIDGGTGASTRDTAVFESGVASLKLVPGASGAAQRRQDVTVRPGQRRQLAVAIRQDGAGSVSLFVQNLHTGKFLSSSGAWVASGPAAQTTADTSGAFTAFTVTLQVEAAPGVKEVTLRITPFANSSTLTAGYVDEVTLAPAVNFLSLHGHNLAPVVSPEMRSSSDGFSAVDTLEATLALERPSCFAYLETAVYRRHWRLKLAGTNVETPWTGEAWLGHAETLAAARGWGYEVAYRRDQIRNRAPAGGQRVTPLGGARRRLIRWGFPTIDVEADFVEIRDDVFDRCGHGEERVVFAARDSDTDQLVVHGRLPQDAGATRAFLETWQAQILLEEDPFPIIVR